MMRACAKMQIVASACANVPRHILFYKICSAGKDIM